METKIRGVRDGGSGEEVNIKTTRHGSVLASQFLPSGAAPTAKGESWQVMTTTSVACLVVRPDTVAHISLYNGKRLAVSPISLSEYLPMHWLPQP